VSWAREQLYVIPNHLQALSIRAAALAQLGRTAEAVSAGEVLLSNYPGLTVDRYLRNFHWKLPGDIAHYRDGLVKAGIPLGTLPVVDPSPKLAADS
jgi:adenylate cyclase